LTYCKEEALENYDQRWALSPPIVREREEFGLPIFTNPWKEYPSI